MGPEESEFVDRMGLIMERFGGTRTMGRLYAWLMICDEPSQSLTDLAGHLGVSKTAVSTVARQMESVSMIERVPASTREHHYRISPGGWTQVLRDQLSRMRPVLETLDFGLSIVGDERPEARSRLEEFREYFAFVERDADMMLRRWQEYRDERHPRE